MQGRRRGDGGRRRDCRPRRAEAPDPLDHGSELGGERVFVAGARADKQVPDAPQLGGERRGVADRAAVSDGVARRDGELGDAVRQNAAPRVRERAKRAPQRMRAQLPLRGARRPLERIRRLAQVLAMAHQLEPAERRRAGHGHAARDEVGSRIVVVERADRHDVRLALHRLDQQRGELAELRAFRVGTAALGDVAGRARDGRRRRLKQLGHVAWGLEPRARQVGDGALDAVEQVGERRQIGERGQPAQRLQGTQHVLQRVVGERVGAQRLGGAVQRAGDGGSFARDERPRARVEPQRLGGADLRRRPSSHLVELLAQRLGLRRVRVGPRARAAHEDLQVVHRADRQLLGLRVPAAPAVVHRARQRFEARRRPRDRLLVRHQRAAAQRPGQPHQLVGAGLVALGEQPVEALQVLPRLEGEEVRHAEGLRRSGHGATS